MSPEERSKAFVFPKMYIGEPILARTDNNTQEPSMGFVQRVDDRTVEAIIFPTQVARGLCVTCWHKDDPEIREIRPTILEDPEVWVFELSEWRKYFEDMQTQINQLASSGTIQNKFLQEARATIDERILEYTKTNPEASATDVGKALDVTPQKVGQVWKKYAEVAAA